MSVRVVLSPREIAEAEALGKAKSGYSAGAGIKDRRFSGSSRDEIDRLGVRGEAAFSKVTGLPMNRRRDKVGGADFEVWVADRLWTIEIKTTGRGRRLLERPWRNLTNAYDIYVLVYGSLGSGELSIHGYVLKEGFFLEGHKKELVPGNGWCWAMEPSSLRPFERLKLAEKAGEWTI
jgi:hypothetical protein